MSENQIRILLMDDEIETSDVVKYAIDALRDAGMTVDLADRMSEVLSGFRERCYDGYVLDVDMSQIHDEYAGDGTEIGLWLRSMDYDARVVVFSARGGPANWFAAANAHLYGYVHKNDDRAIDHLVDAVQSAVRSPTTPIMTQPQAPPRRVLVGVNGPVHLAGHGVGALAAKALPGWEIVEMDDLEQVSSVLVRNPTVWGLCILAADEFEADPDILDAITEICALASQPHTVVMCRGDTSAQASILRIVNARPFRLLDSLNACILDTFNDAVDAAVRHYGQFEHLAPDDSAVGQICLGFSETTLADYEPDGWDDEEDEP